MFTSSLLGLALVSATAFALPYEDSSNVNYARDVPSFANFAKRQDFNISASGDGGSINGTIPVPCITGCIDPFMNLG